jgi:alpha-tubulin suppressor-like RCC1 family protein
MAGDQRAASDGRTRVRLRAGALRVIVVLAFAVFCSAAGAASATQIAVGSASNCAVVAGGHVECWGRNSSGQLGDGTYTGPELCGESYCSLVPVEVRGISTATRVSAYEDTACALLSSGHVDCWGAVEPGYGTKSKSDVPIEVQGISTATQVAVESNTDCALLSSGHVECWGSNERGELGDGTTEAPETCGELHVPCSRTPVEVRGIATAAQLAAGAGDSCAALAGGQVECWGENTHGQLGDASTTQSDTPVEVQGISTATEVAVGSDHTCALLSSAQLECWGENAYGELGEGTTAQSDTPVEVQGISTATEVAVGSPYDGLGGSDTCALLAGGQVECWGWNGYDELASGTAFEPLVPVEVRGTSTAVQASAAGSACALASSGDVSCWGETAGGAAKTESEVPVAFPGLSDALQLSGDAVDGCATLATGHVQCWGDGEAGQLGDGTTVSSQAPVEVQGITNAIQVDTGGSHSCAVLTSGHVDCWGENADGDLGNGTAHSSDVPVEVLGITTATQVAVGVYHSCAALTSGHVDCWGENELGQLDTRRRSRRSRSTGRSKWKGS